MNRTALKNYAPKARREFIQAVTDRAAFYGLTAKKIEPVVEKGDVEIIGGRAFPRSIIRQRLALEGRIGRQSFDQVMEAMAYTWFNRFVALHYMELHQYLEHGYRVLSHPEGKTTPEIIEHAEHLDLPGLDKNKVIELKLDGTKEAELYRLLLVAQCNALHEAMPFLFERIDDETELLLPDNLLHSDSVIRKLVNEIEEEDWKEVEIIGWIYQFYISEKKDRVIGKVVKSEDIPAATQLFTPNWIVKYLVQNTLGRQWLATYPDSPLRKQMEYYIEPAEQSEEVKAQLKAITPDTLNPEELTLLDPACGSGHILVESYGVFKAIYQERGYRSRDIPRIILQKNLYGLEIDDRAAQLAAFALLMKARADDRSVFADRIQPNVLAIQESKGLEKLLRPDAADVSATGQPLVADQDLFPDTKKQLPLKKQPQESTLAAVEPCLRELIKLFEHGKTFGSLICVPPDLAAKLPAARRNLEAMTAKGQLWEHGVALLLSPLVREAELLGRSYNAVVTNPPYMGSKGMNETLKDFAKHSFPTSRSDLFAMFIDRSISLSLSNGTIGLVTPFVWMFLSTYASLRNALFASSCITSLIQLEYNAFEPACVPVCAFVIYTSPIRALNGDYIRLNQFKGSETQGPKTLEAICDSRSNWRFRASTEDFMSVPGVPIAYWISKNAISIFRSSKKLADFYEPRQGLATGNNDHFLRFWAEVSASQIGFNFEIADAARASQLKWFPCQKGGGNWRWYGLHEYLVNWQNDGKELRTYPGAVIRNPDYYFQPGATWSSLTISNLSMRLSPPGFIFESKGPVCFPKDGASLLYLIAYANSVVINYFLSVLAPTMDYSQGPLGRVPLRRCSVRAAEELAESAIRIAVRDWDSYETSWNFQTFPWLSVFTAKTRIKDSWQWWEIHTKEQIKQMQDLETENNKLFISAYDLGDELQPNVPEEQVTLTRADREQDIKRLISYAIGCMMGRYSLDKPELIYAHGADIGFDPDQYKKFVPDADGIIPVTEVRWFPNDATERLVEFVATDWGSECLEENLKFIADSLRANKEEQPRVSIRRYFTQSFFRDHQQTYNKRPIYWLFSSGKQKAFQCLVYLHRYHEGTLARMRTEYVIPLQGKITARIEQLASDIQKATSTSHRKKLEKEQDTLKKQQIELQAFDEKLRHYADMRINLNLDDGVKVNYGKFGDLLADVKIVTGGVESAE